MAKAKDLKIRMQSTETHHMYTTTKNAKNTPEKMELSKYDPIARKHVKYKEAKIKK